jgi:hypothetical protein
LKFLSKASGNPTSLQGIGTLMSSLVVPTTLTGEPSDGVVMMVWELLLQSPATATEKFLCQVDVGMCSK